MVHPPVMFSRDLAGHGSGGGDGEKIISECPAPFGGLALGGAIVLGALLIASGAWGQVWEVGEQGLVLTSGPQSVAQFGQVLAGGDFNGDGYRDLAAGAPLWDSPAADGGRVQIYLGGTQGLGASTISFSGSAPDMRLGAALAAGDFDNDGEDELAIGSPGWDVAAINAAGRVYVIDYNGASWDLSFWEQGDLSLTDEDEDQFGEVLAVGDFDNDSYEDLAVGMPHEGFALSNSGAVVVINGSASGLTATGSFFANQATLAPPEQAGAGMGRSLAAGDFNGDDVFYDLAVGAPAYDIGALVDAGAVAILSGSAGGVSVSGVLVTEVTVGGTVQAGDEFGHALATGDFNRTAACWNAFSCRTDLAIGVPGQMVSGLTNAGRIAIVYDDASVQQIDQGNLTGSSPEASDRFGEVLLSEWVGSATLNGPSFGFPGADDLVIGVPGENWNGVAFQGVVHLVFGSAAGLNAGETSQWRIAAAGLSSAPPAAFDNFGYALALGDFDSGGYCDLAIGVPGRDSGATANSGLVQVMYGALFADGFESAGILNW